MSSPLRILFYQCSFSKTVTGGHSENLFTDLIKENESGASVTGREFREDRSRKEEKQ